MQNPGVPGHALASVNVPGPCVASDIPSLLELLLCVPCELETTARMKQ